MLACTAARRGALARARWAARAGGGGRPGPLAQPFSSAAPQGSFPDGGQQGNPFTMFEQLGRTMMARAQEAAQRIGESAGTGSPAPLLQDLQGLAYTNLSQLSQYTVPLFTAMLILTRATPGQPLTAEQQEKISEVLGREAGQILKTITDVVPEDPHVAQLKRIADALVALDAKLSNVALASPAPGKTAPAAGSE